ncbi:MAG: hypothetical protein RLY21_921 [Planctomycetota bacterium]|jgi:uncharacterized protein
MSLAPIAPAERLRAVDIARGLALLGILFVNIRYFFAPFGVAMDPTVALDGSERTAADSAAWAFVETFCSFKFISLFSLLFGFGLAMQAARATALGRSPWPAGQRRLAILALIGILHWSLVWYGDILTLYALLGVIALACSGLSQRSLGWIIVVVAVLVALNAFGAAALYAVGMMMLLGAAEAEAAVTTERGLKAMLEAGFDPLNPAWIEGERAAFAEGPFRDALLFRCVLFAYGFIAALFSYGWQSLFMMLCGVYAFKAGFFGPEGAAFRRRIALPALLLGLALSFGSALPSLILGFDSTPARVTYLLLVSLSAMVLPFAYAAIIIEWGPKLPSFIATPLERAGRMSFTVYLCESLVCTALASWWGLAWFGTLDDAQAAVTAFVVWLALVLFATAWLAIFRIGPFEWLWRMVTYVGNTRTSKPIPA